MEVDVLGSPSPIVITVSVDVKQHWPWSGLGRPAGWMDNCWDLLVRCQRGQYGVGTHTARCNQALCTVHFSSVFTSGNCPSQWQYMLTHSPELYILYSRVEGMSDVVRSYVSGCYFPLCHVRNRDQESSRLCIAAGFSFCSLLPSEKHCFTDS